MTDASIIPLDILYKETDARMWAQTGYKPGQKLDRNNPTDKAMEPVWRDIFRKVQSEANGGRLVTTFDHPEVAQHLADAAVANAAAGAHANVAASAPNQATSRDNIVAATTAHQISTFKAREAANKQPPTVSPQLVHAASKEIANNPPPPQAPANEHIAHKHVYDGGALSHAREVHEQAQARKVSLESLYKATDEIFWNRTHYKPGQKLDPRDPADKAMEPVWRDIFRQVQRDPASVPALMTPPFAATLPMEAPSMPVLPGVSVGPLMGPPTGPLMDPPMGPPSPPMGPPTGPPPPMGPPTGPPPPMGPPTGPPPPMGPPTGPPRPTGPPTGPPRPMPPRPMPPRPMPPRPMPPRPMPPRPMGPPMDPSMGLPMGPSMGLPMPGRPPSGPSMGPPETPMPGAPGGGSSGPPSEPLGPPGEPSPGAPGEAPSPPAEEPSGVGKYIAIGLAVITGGGLLYYATTRNPSPPPRARRAFVPPRASRAASAGMARSMRAQGGSDLELEE